MALTINNSIASINARRQLEKHTLQLGKTFARLSSGMRINTSQDDAAGMAITNRMVAQIRGMNVAIRNANDGISLAQVAEGALDETQNALQRMRELAIQAANSTYSSSDRANLQDEFEQMLSEIQRISSDTTFNNNILLGGSANGRYGTSFRGTFHVGADAGQTITIRFSVMNVSALGLVKLHATNTVASAIAKSAQVSIGVAAKANSALGFIDSALDAVSTFRASLGALQSRFETVISSLSNIVENTDAARSRIQDADIALETANLTKYTILQQAGVAILAQANQQPTIALALLGA
ncbi:MAG: flagellin FliC [Magnetococcales bacterium]|nr:flagellin FliC [Magnetococcales bacterium]MBF0150423.1 flagellin FliC [Magnetococcales bacterium]MBF0346805.1 flagellin FliC [Magnetococcales bacterium]MBF0630949.1 flagellin FliC [Magnetococcales bacterium]